jgi:sister-chromatid-cohesion protein PDS5
LRGCTITRHELDPFFQKLYNYLCDRKQKDEGDDGEPNLQYIAAQLIQSHLVKNSDRNISILVACCLYDIVRVYAPDAPYEPHQLEVIRGYRGCIWYISEEIILVYIRLCLGCS